MKKVKEAIQITNQNFSWADRKSEIPHYLQVHKVQMQHYVAEIHFLNQEASVMALCHHYEQFQPGCAYPNTPKQMK